MTADGVARVALTSHLITSSQVNELQRRITASPTSDEVDLLGTVARLSEAQLEKLRVEVITRRAARSFAPEQGEFVLEDKICLPVHACQVDVRAVVYHGIRMHVSDVRLSNELRMLGGNYFVLEQDAAAELHTFGFCDGEWPMIAALREGISLPELEARHRDIDPRTMQAAIYALVVCGAAQVTAPPRTSSGSGWETKTPPPLPRTHTPSSPPIVAHTHTPNSPPVISRTQTPGSVSYPIPSRTQTPSTSPVVARTQTPSPVVARTQSSPAVGRSQTPSTSPVVSRTPTPRQPIARMPTSPPLGGRAPTAPPMFARSGSRDDVPAVGRTKTNPELAAEAAERANRALASDRPEAAVMELKKAVELVPNDVDYNALLGWALFCAADDKVAAATESRKLLEKALYKSHQPEIARFYLGRVERILGRDKEALRHFTAVLDVEPNHRDACAEVRVIEARLKRLNTSN